MRLDHRIRSVINKHSHEAGVKHAAELREGLLARAKELTKAKTPVDQIAAALGFTLPAKNDPT